MRARLGFAVAERIDPQVLLLDEVHEAFDHEYRAVVETTAHRILDAGGIVIAAGHDHQMLARLCTQGLLLRDGAIVEHGALASVRQDYLGAHA